MSKLSKHDLEALAYHQKPSPGKIQVVPTKKYATQSELDQVDKSIKERVLECEKFAESSPYPDLSLMYDAVYEQEDYPFIKHKL